MEIWTEMMQHIKSQERMQRLPKKKKTEMGKKRSHPDDVSRGNNA